MLCSLWFYFVRGHHVEFIAFYILERFKTYWISVLLFEILIDKAILILHIIYCEFLCCFSVNCSIWSLLYLGYFYVMIPIHFQDLWWIYIILIFILLHLFLFFYSWLRLINFIMLPIKASISFYFYFLFTVLILLA